MNGKDLEKKQFQNWIHCFLICLLGLHKTTKYLSQADGTAAP